MQKLLYIFDFDLTIADTAAASVNTYIAAFATLGLKFDENDVFRHLKMPLEQTYNEAILSAKKPASYEDFRAAFEKSSTEVFGSVGLYDDVISCFERIVGEGARLAIVTTRFKRAVLSVLDKYPEAEKYVCSLVTSDDVKRFKPFPDPILKCLSETGVRPADAVYIGDAENDMLAATAAGVDFIYVDRTGFVNKTGAILSLEQLG
mgnify:CR=1 FL=1